MIPQHIIDILTKEIINDYSFEELYRYYYTYQHNQWSDSSYNFDDLIETIYNHILDTSMLFYKYRITDVSDTMMYPMSHSCNKTNEKNFTEKMEKIWEINYQKYRNKELVLRKSPIFSKLPLELYLLIRNKY